MYLCHSLYQNSTAGNVRSASLLMNLTQANAIFLLKYWLLVWYAAWPIQKISNVALLAYRSISLAPPTPLTNCMQPASTLPLLQCHLNLRRSLFLGCLEIITTERFVIHIVSGDRPTCRRLMLRFSISSLWRRSGSAIFGRLSSRDILYRCLILFGFKKSEWYIVWPNGAEGYIRACNAVVNN